MAQGDVRHPGRFTTELLVAAIRYVRTDGNDAGNNCTNPTAPCRTVQHAVDESAPGDEIRVAAGTYNDVNSYGGLSQIVYVTQTLTLRGGYSADFAAWSPETYVATLDAENNGRGVYISGEISPSVEGFRITRGNATGLGGGSLGSADAGGGVYVVTATATISGNDITANVASTSDFDDGQGGGVYLLNSDALVANNGDSIIHLLEIVFDQLSWAPLRAWR